ncbi:hypothetical protein OF83DRAFT_1168405 [Amylostereum chailletii]|nr:hypothetical protein OF83DRAFT_1168405 [Amylostereum chailletii]
MSNNTLSSAAFESLLLKLLAVLELTQRPQGSSTPQEKQELLRAITDFRDSLNRAKELATALPGGELLIQEQDEIIAMLETMRDKKREQLARFSERVLQTANVGLTRMEIDSNASTPPS